MKKNIHPEYQQVLFIDSSTGIKFLCGSALKSKDKEMFEGKEYPVCKVSISSYSHPFFTGSKQLVDAEGRVDKFKKRYAAKQEQSKEPSQEESKELEQPKKAAKKAPKK